MHRYHPRHVKRRTGIRRMYAAAMGALLVMVAGAMSAQEASADYYGTRFADGTKPICVSTQYIDNSTVNKAVRAAVADWSASSKLDVRTRSSCINYKQRIKVVDASYAGVSWIGQADVTRSWWGESPTPYRWTKQGYTYLHDRVTLRFNLAKSTKQPYSKVLSTATHEIGHALGLNHVTHTCNSVMTPDWDCWRSTVQNPDVSGSWDHPGVNRLYWEG